MKRSIWCDWGPPPDRIHASDRGSFDEQVRRGRPALVEGALDGWEALSRWNFEYMASVAGDRMVPVEFYPGGTYYQRWPSYDMKLKRYLELISAPTGPERYYLAEVALDTTLPEIAGDVVVPPCIEADRLRRTALFAGRDTVTALHYHDIVQALLCQVIGTKRVVMFPPEDFKNLYFEPWYSSIFNFSKVNFDDVDVNDYPALRRARPVECILQPGDALFIPMHWGHLVEGEGVNSSVTFFWTSRWHEWKPVPAALHAVAGCYFRWGVSRPLVERLARWFRLNVS